MKIALAVLALCFGLPLSAADDAEEKERLVQEVLAVVDPRPLVETTLYVESARYGPEAAEIVRRVLPRVDYRKVAEEWFGKELREEFTTRELRELAAFYRTDAGRKAAALHNSMARFIGQGPPISVATLVREVRDDLQREDAKAHPLEAVMNDLRTIATCLEARATDTNEYPVVTFEELPPLLEPTYVRKLPRVDPWGTPYAYVSDGRSYLVVSAGADGRFEWDSRTIRPMPPEVVFVDGLDADIIFQDGNFRQAPKQAAPPRSPQPH